MWKWLNVLMVAVMGYMVFLGVVYGFWELGLLTQGQRPPRLSPAREAAVAFLAAIGGGIIIYGVLRHTFPNTFGDGTLGEARLRKGGLLALMVGCVVATVLILAVIALAPQPTAQPSTGTGSGVPTTGTEAEKGFGNTVPTGK